MYGKTQEQNMEFEAFYESDEDTTGPRTLSYIQAKGKAIQCRGSRCLVLIAVGLGLICVLLLVFIILQNITITAERDLINSHKNTVEEFNQTINSLQDNYTDLMTEKHQLQNNKLELETRVNDLTAEKSQLQRDFDSLGQRNLDFERKVTTLSDELKKNVSKGGNQCSLDGLFVSKKAMSWSDSRKYCRDRGGDLVIINTEEKQRLMSSLVRLSERAWIGLSDRENEGNLTWVDNSTLKQGFWFEGEPNDEHGNEDCVEIMVFSSTLNNWNDLPCSEKRKGICEK
ncbi:C-type lectin domain family 4 member E-like isoform X1 [Onychostoma macrolepis]|uniref:C-type lectin domain family 4 member E-like isoform X1 n=1 Tax=Onychostoma macrolepis TaxID=369639 RepID=UPI002729C73B|nr:C-type lectin domain family 4 member E-like isoform X1 [Onychostoma macrolepis]